VHRGEPQCTKRRRLAQVRAPGEPCLAAHPPNSTSCDLDHVHRCKPLAGFPAGAEDRTARTRSSRPRPRRPIRGRGPNALTGARRLCCGGGYLLSLFTWLSVRFLAGESGSRRQLFQAILITVIWILFWPLMLLLVQALGMIWPENDGARNGDERHRGL
jgi:hypothetical protein